MLPYLHTNVDGKGFTLVEMVTVLFIVGILVAIVLGTGRNAVYNSRATAARTDLHLIADALDRYCMVFGDYPVSPSNRVPVNYSRKTLGDQDAHGKQGSYHFKNLLPNGFTAIDPWGKPYIYTLTRNDNPDEFPVYSLRSCGQDGKEGTEDDIVYP